MYYLLNGGGIAFAFVLIAALDNAVGENGSTRSNTACGLSQKIMAALLHEITKTIIELICNNSKEIIGVLSLAHFFFFYIFRYILFI